MDYKPSSILLEVAYRQYWPLRYPKFLKEHYKSELTSLWFEITIGFFLTLKYLKPFELTSINFSHEFFTTLSDKCQFVEAKPFQWSDSEQQSKYGLIFLLFLSPWHRRTHDIEAWFSKLAWHLLELPSSNLVGFPSKTPLSWRWFHSRISRWVSFLQLHSSLQ